MRAPRRFESARTASPDAAGAQYRSVLVGLSGSPSEPTVLEEAVTVALRDRARLTLLASVPSPPASIWLAPALPEDPRRALERDCELRLLEAARALPATVSVVTILQRGSAARAMLAELRTGRHDLVVVGSPRRRRMPRIAPGTARTLLRDSPVPVLVVSASARARSQPAGAHPPRVLTITEGV